MRRFDPNRTLPNTRGRGAWPGLDFGGMTLDEVRAKIRGEEAKDAAPADDAANDAQERRS